MAHPWTPSLVPDVGDPNVYLVIDCLDGLGCVWREADIGGTDLETVIDDLLAGQYSDPLCVIGLNAAEHWSGDVTADIATEIKRRCDRDDRDVPIWLEDFVHRHVAPDRQLNLRLV